LRVYKKEIGSLFGEDKKNGGGSRSPFGGLGAGLSTDELVLLHAAQDKLTDMRLKLG